MGAKAAKEAAKKGAAAAGGQARRSYPQKPQAPSTSHGTSRPVPQHLQATLLTREGVDFEIGRDVAYGAAGDENDGGPRAPHTLDELADFVEAGANVPRAETLASARQEEYVQQLRESTEAAELAAQRPAAHLLEVMNQIEISSAPADLPKQLPHDADSIEADSFGIRLDQMEIRRILVEAQEGAKSPGTIPLPESLDARAAADRVLSSLPPSSSSSRISASSSAAGGAVAVSGDSASCYSSDDEELLRNLFRYTAAPRFAIDPTKTDSMDNRIRGYWPYSIVD